LKKITKTDKIMAMNTIELFGFTWKNEIQNSLFHRVNVLTNDQIGQVAFTLNCLQCIKFDIEWKEENYYKLLSLIHEKTICGKPYFIYKKEDKNTLENLGSEVYKYTPVENINVLRDFPKNIIELQRRSLLMLYRQYPRYGDDIKNPSHFDFFSKDYYDFVFLLDAMRRKFWIDFEIKEKPNGLLDFSKPISIAEEGWIEIEKNLEMNYTKQVFVAMWFKKDMDKAAQKIKEAITACGLEAMRIDRKEHNNEISGEILSEIMNSRIIIADVTGQRNGVYFEAGFALGHQKSVIWTCKKDDLENVHFDTRQYNHVVWENEDDLYTKLRDRILATLAIESK
jgi:nucleoside 2-deoxyribosyltransferase